MISLIDIDSIALLYDGIQLPINVLVIEPPRGKTNNVVSEQVRHKPSCTATERS